MKKIISILALCALFTACSTEEEVVFTYEINPVAQVTFPTKFASDSTTVIPVKYVRPSSCHLFNNFYYEADGFNRKVAIETLKVIQDNCTVDDETLITVNLKFKPVGIGTYHFMFWTGENAQGVDQYLEFDATVDH